MNIRTTGFSPLKVMSDNAELPVHELTYLDENGETRTLSYIMVNGEKIPIQYRVELDKKLSALKIDDALLEVEEERKEKVEEDKSK